MITQNDSLHFGETHGLGTEIELMSASEGDPLMRLTAQSAREVRLDGHSQPISLQKGIHPTRCCFVLSKDFFNRYLLTERFFENVSSEELIS